MTVSASSNQRVVSGPARRWPSLAALDRGARLAKALCQTRNASLTVLLEDGSRAASDGAGRTIPPPSLAERVLADGALLWIEDAALEPRAEGSSGPARSGLRIGAAIRSQDGVIRGALCVSDPAPRAYEAETADALKDLADLMGESAWAAASRDEKAETDEPSAGESDRPRLLEALEAAARSEQRMTLAMEIADVHVWEMDYVRGVLIKTGAEDTFFTQPRLYRDLLEDPFSPIDPRDRPAAEAAWRRHLEDGTPYHVEFRVIRSDDKEVWAASSSRLVADASGRPLRLIGAMQDISERKAQEKALRQAKEAAEGASLAKTAFLATMSHEIRTPLNGVLGMVQAMAGDDLNERQRERLEIVRRSGETLLHVLNSVLDISKIEAGQLELQEIDFELGDLVRGVVAAFQSDAGDRGLRLGLLVEPDAEGGCRGDRGRLLQILHHLLANAVKFTERGSVDLHVARSGDQVKISVRDTGIGISAESLPRLFRRFEPLDGSTTRRRGGAGLGLALCRELAQVLGGDISVQSQEGQGSTFTIDLPLARKAQTVPPPALETPPSQAQTSLRILAAEDNRVNQLVLKTLLNQAGVEPVIVADGLQALRAYETASWDLILMDVQMPVLDGPGAVRAIRALETASGRARTPILALTANAMAHQIPDYLTAGMDGLIAKPIIVAELFGSIESALLEAESARAPPPAPRLSEVVVEPQAHVVEALVLPLVEDLAIGEVHIGGLKRPLLSDVVA